MANRGCRIPLRRVTFSFVMNLMNMHSNLIRFLLVQGLSEGLHNNPGLQLLPWENDAMKT